MPRSTEPRLAVAKLLLQQGDDVQTAEALLKHTLDATGADRGFVVAREEGEFVPKFSVQFDAETDGDSARFSRSLVRRALAANLMVHSMNPAEDPELSGLESLFAAAGRAVVVVPLSSEGALFGALYLEHPKPGGFSPASLSLLSEIAELAGLCLYGAVRRTALERRTSALERSLFAQYDFSGIVTQDPAMLALLQSVAQVAPSKASILITGESGTGKELIAKALHVNSDRRRGPLVTLHCAALPSTMLESELFGHVRGAFTGADRERAGRLASAHRGTLFLDEIAEIPMETQAKLLRALQFGELQRLGSDRIEKVDVRVVAATHGSLAERVAQGTFRQDLYYRIRVVELSLPPLRERRSDIALLAQHFLKDAPRKHLRLSGEVLACLEAYDFPGNVRELAHAIERAALLSTETEITRAFLPAEIRDAGPRRLDETLGTARTEDGSWLDWLTAAATTFTADRARHGPSTWSELTDFVEQYLKPYALAHLGQVTNAESLEGISIPKVSDALKADRGTVLKHLRRFFESRQRPRA